MRFKILTDGYDGVSICMDCNSSLQSFIDIYTGDESTPSPFENIDDAKLFAEIIIKLLGVIYESRR